MAANASDSVSAAKTEQTSEKRWKMMPVAVANGNELRIVAWSRLGVSSEKVTRRTTDRH